jgi:hypothetical protein
MKDTECIGSYLIYLLYYLRIHHLFLILEKKM